MNRSRTAFAVIAIAAIVFLSLAPAAEARSLRSKPSVSESRGSWLDAAMVWLSSILPGQGDATRTTEKSQPAEGDHKPIIVGPQYTGSCIDPDGCTWGG